MRLASRSWPDWDDAYGHAEGFVDGAHPAGVAARQIVVDGDDVDGAAGEGVEIGGEGGHEGFAFARSHLGDAAFVQCHATDQLHVEVAHLAGAAGRLAHGGERFGNQGIEGFAGLVAGAEVFGAGGEGLVAQFRKTPFEGVDAVHQLAEPLQFATVLGAEDSLKHGALPWLA